MVKQCPQGCETGSSVLDSRETPDSIRRRRQCPQCGTRWTTWEIGTPPAQGATIGTIEKHLQEVGRRSAEALGVLKRASHGRQSAKA